MLHSHKFRVVTFILSLQEYHGVLAGLLSVLVISEGKMYTRYICMYTIFQNTCAQPLLFVNVYLDVCALPLQELLSTQLDTLTQLLVCSQ